MVELFLIPFTINLSIGICIGMAGSFLSHAKSHFYLQTIIAFCMAMYTFNSWGNFFVKSYLGFNRYNKYVDYNQYDKNIDSFIAFIKILAFVLSVITTCSLQTFVYFLGSSIYSLTFTVFCCMPLCILIVIVALWPEMSKEIIAIKFIIIGMIGCLIIGIICGRFFGHVLAVIFEMIYESGFFSRLLA